MDFIVKITIPRVPVRIPIVIAITPLSSFWPSAFASCEPVEFWWLMP